MDEEEGTRQHPTIQSRGGRRGKVWKRASKGKTYLVGHFEWMGLVYLVGWSRWLVVGRGAKRESV